MGPPGGPFQAGTQGKMPQLPPLWAALPPHQDLLLSAKVEWDTK